MRLLGCSAAAEAREVYLSPSQSEGGHLLGLWADWPSTGCWFQDLGVYGEGEYVYGVHFCVSMLGVCVSVCIPVHEGGNACLCLCCPVCLCVSGQVSTSLRTSQANNA